MNKSIRHNSGKLKWSLVHFASLATMVRVLEFGCKKYSKDNWKIGLDCTEILESIQRHLASLFDGETRDKETGEYHIGHIMCNCMFWMYHYNLNKLNKLKDENEESAKS